MGRRWRVDLCETADGRVSRGRSYFDVDDELTRETSTRENRITRGRASVNLFHSPPRYIIPPTILPPPSARTHDFLGDPLKGNPRRSETCRNLDKARMALRGISAARAATHVLSSRVIVVPRILFEMTRDRRYNGRGAHGVLLVDDKVTVDLSPTLHA